MAQNNNFQVGILQGRLSPSEDGRLQFFPGDWRREFGIAKEMGFDAIEWLFDWPEAGQNPIITPQGRQAIKTAVEETGVQVSSICADYYMKYRFDGNDAKQSVEVLEKLIEAAADVTTQKLILIPLLEANAPKTPGGKKEIITAIKSVLPYAQERGVRIGFENEMPFEELEKFLENFSSENVGSYYDLGNATSYGFDCPKDILLLGDKVFGVHAKDRKVHATQSVLLGRGDVAWQPCFEALNGIGFKGVVIIQAWREEDYLKSAQDQLLFLKNIIGA